MPALTTKPNILLILADDLGFSDLGCFGGEVATPNLDALAKEGMRLSGFHTASACSPTRSMLFSGTDNHLAGLGQMAETISQNEVFQGKAGYEGMLNQRVAALSEILQDNGYGTYMSGKWHLGMTPDSLPHARGFDRVFGLLPGGGNHYGYEPYLDDGTPAVKVLPPIYVEDGNFVDHRTFAKPFYSTTTFTNRMLGYLEEHDSTKPFFAYLPYTAPHWPLQAPPEIVAKYRGKYDDGPEALRQRRLAALKREGLVDEDVTSLPIVSTFEDKPWAEMTAEEKAVSARKMEVYAAMIEVMDAEIGRVVSWLKETGTYESTFIFFCSDNGAEGAMLEALPVLGEEFQKTIERFFDNSLDNIGRYNSFTSIGPAWAQAATAPNRMYKAWITEGGIRCPALLRYPNFRNGEISHEFCTIMDVLPTILEMADIPHPAPEYRGRKVLQPRGRSWVKYLTNKAEYVHDDNAVHGWELFGQSAIRQGPWKAVWIPGKDAKWSLYNLASDAGETRDLADDEPERLTEMVRLWRDYEAETGVVRLDPDQAFALRGYGFYRGTEP
ncbi:hypothetical protein NBRC10512_003957 [Rhodotorula toruloides]|uniref:RHTO0S07e05336g1_1 n=2 Tax=Rhodotorula toruloides TaxID=5286 RepID=A0A061AZB6_RHOTO|nr:arylsulfatase [Rhodotorula toruloides NP11]EMS25162.1 arylsulfatase [Rhodotorula toruloides NP11]CDR42904.1 RHTO0S07e05336g1_1 [Rhodotorula toruloides]